MWNKKEGHVEQARFWEGGSPFLSPYPTSGKVIDCPMVWVTINNGKLWKLLFVYSLHYDWRVVGIQILGGWMSGQTDGKMDGQING